MNIHRRNMHASRERAIQIKLTFSLFQAISVDDRDLADDTNSFDEKTTVLGRRLFSQRPKTYAHLFKFKTKGIINRSG